MKLLIVDDNKEFVEVQKELLEAHGFDVIAAYSGNEGLEALSRLTVDMVISDISMPDGDGVYLLEESKKLTDCPIVVLMTGHSDISEADLLVKGAAALLKKPVKIADLVEKIHNLSSQGE